MDLHKKAVLRGVLLSALLSSLFTVGAVAAPLGVGTVTADGLRLRAQANTSSPVLAVAPSGSTADVLSEETEGWYKVSYKGIEGYMSARYLTVAPAEAPETGKVASGGASLNVRSGPGTSYSRIGSLRDGTQVELLEQEGGWYRIRSGALMGYVFAEYVLPEEEAQAEPVPAAAEDGQAPALPPEAEAQAEPSKGEQVAAYAETLLGKPYVYGGSGPNGFDCSGFVYYVYGHFGVTLNRGASGQMSNGKAVEREELRPGDLVFFQDGTVTTAASHVGIYVGEDRFIHASTNSNCVQYNSMEPDSLYDRRFVGARRIFD